MVLEENDEGFLERVENVEILNIVGEKRILLRTIDKRRIMICHLLRH